MGGMLDLIFAPIRFVIGIVIKPHVERVGKMTEEMLDEYERKGFPG